VTQLAVHYHDVSVGGGVAQQQQQQQQQKQQQQQQQGGTMTIAVGLVCGDALLMRGDMLKDRLQRARVKLGPPGDTAPGACTGLELAKLSPDRSEDLTLFCVTEKFTASAQVLRVLQVLPPLHPFPSRLPFSYLTAVTYCLE
jgi:hypothetical protein